MTSKERANPPLTPLRTSVRSEPGDQSFLGAPPLLPFDDRAAYDRLSAAVTEAMEPIDVFGVIWARDFTDLQWDIIRFRRIRANFVKAHLKDEFGGDESEETSAVIANIPMIQRIDHMIATYEGRRNAAYREAERHRVNLGAQLHRAVEQVTDVEFREVDETSDQKRAA